MVFVWFTMSHLAHARAAKSKARKTHTGLRAAKIVRNAFLLAMQSLEHLAIWARTNHWKCYAILAGGFCVGGVVFGGGAYYCCDNHFFTSTKMFDSTKTSFLSSRTIAEVFFRGTNWPRRSSVPVSLRLLLNWSIYALRRRF